MSGKSWQQRLEDLLCREQRHSFYATLARTSPEGYQGLQDMLTRSRPQLLRVSGGSQGGDSRGSARAASGPGASSWERAQSSREEPSSPNVGEPDFQPRPAASAPASAPAATPQADPNPQESDPNVSLAVRWCRLSGLQDLAEWLQKYWPADPQVAAELCRMHLLVACLRLDPESTKSIVRDREEFSGDQAMNMAHRASQLFYEFAYRAQGRAGAEEISREIIHAEATRFLRWMQAEVRQSPYAWLAERLRVLRDGPFQSDVHDFVGEPHGQVKLLSFLICAAPPDNQMHRALATSAHQGRLGAR